MNQPDLGKKIAELRKAKGLTQEELVEKCNLSVRTLQRIESGEVTPRSYTVKAIFTALDYTVNDSVETISGELKQTGFNFSNWPGQLYRYVIDLFNLKTNTMKKITILSVILFALILGLFAVCSESKAQKVQKAQKAIETAQNKLNVWLYSGQIDSVLTMYSDDACDIPHSICGKTNLYEMLRSNNEHELKLIEFRILSVSVGDSVAVEKYYQEYIFAGNIYKQTGLTEWRFTKGKWLIVNDIY
jgi:transcriptional regulator with XRE-family HTH domain